MKRKRSFYIIILHLFFVLLGVVFVLEPYSTPLSLPVTRSQIIPGEGIPINGIFDKNQVRVIARGIFTSAPTDDGYLTAEQAYYLSRIDLEEDVMSTVEALSIEAMYTTMLTYSSFLDTYPSDFSNHYDAYMDVLSPESEHYKLFVDYQAFLRPMYTMGQFDTYIIDEKNKYNKINSAEIYYNTQLDYRIILVESDVYHYLWIDEQADMSLEYIYRFSDQLEDVNAVKENQFEQTLYKSYIKMLADQQDRIDLDYDSNALMILKQRSTE